MATSPFSPILTKSPSSIVSAIDGYGWRNKFESSIKSAGWFKTEYLNDLWQLKKIYDSNSKSTKSVYDQIKERNTGSSTSQKSAAEQIKEANIASNSSYKPSTTNSDLYKSSPSSSSAKSSSSSSTKSSSSSSTKSTESPYAKYLTMSDSHIKSSIDKAGWWDAFEALLKKNWGFKTEYLNDIYTLKKKYEAASKSSSTKSSSSSSSSSSKTELPNEINVDDTYETTKDSPDNRITAAEFKEFLGEYKDYVTDIIKQNNGDFDDYRTNYLANLKEFENDMSPKYKDLYDKIKAQAVQVDKDFLEMKSLNKWYFTDAMKVLGQKAAGSKAGVSSLLSGKWISPTVISNSLQTVDSKYDEQKLTAEASHINNLNDLSTAHNNAINVLLQNQANLTQNEQQFLQYLEQSKNAIEDKALALQQGNQQLLTMPLSKYFEDKTIQVVGNTLNTEDKLQKLDEYKNSWTDLRKKYLSDYAGGFGIEGFSTGDLASAAQIDNLADALTFLQEKAGWVSSWSTGYNPFAGTATSQIGGWSSSKTTSTAPVEKDDSTSTIVDDFNSATSSKSKDTPTKETAPQKTVAEQIKERDLATEEKTPSVIEQIKANNAKYSGTTMGNPDNATTMEVARNKNILANIKAIENESIKVMAEITSLQNSINDGSAGSYNVPIYKDKIKKKQSELERLQENRNKLIERASELWIL
jgi:hypothetical protein